MKTELASVIAGAMNRPDKPVWELVGLDQMTYSKLPYPQKQILMRRAGYPIKIGTGCKPQSTPRFMDWAIVAFSREHAQRVKLMGEKLAMQSWEWR